MVCMFLKAVLKNVIGTTCPAKPEIFIIWLFTGKNVLTPAVRDYKWSGQDVG